MTQLAAFAADITSQRGEDGILAELIRRLEIGTGTCVEFGAWDGRVNSNTWTLWHDHGWTAVLIESEPDRYDDLVDATATHPAVRPVLARVTGSNLAELVGVPCVDILSIDIDGDDYHVWSETTLDARIVVIEYNASLPPPHEYVQSPGDGCGSSCAALLALGTAKGYRLAAMTDVNMIFVRSDQFDRLGIDDVDIAAAFDPWAIPLVICDYAGRHRIVRPSRFGWQGATLDGKATSDAVRTLGLELRRQARKRLPAVAKLYRRLRY